MKSSTQLSSPATADPGSTPTASVPRTAVPEHPASTEAAKTKRWVPDAAESLYRGRTMREGYPGLIGLYSRHYTEQLESLQAGTATVERVDRFITYLSRAADLRPPHPVLVVGSGPEPVAMRVLMDRGFACTGVEPIPDFVVEANKHLQQSGVVLEGAAEALPVPDESQQLVFCESVLEHVDSPRLALDEMHRVLRPGGMAFIVTTNRHCVTKFAELEEFNIPFFRWFPKIVRESYVFRHLHYDPRLANFTLRPAVHWFTFAELCQLGRYSGFERFYSLVDLLRPSDAMVRRHRLRRFLLRGAQRNPWLRALVLTQVGESIVMLKRARPRPKR